jgi:hypothetical protein
MRLIRILVAAAIVVVVPILTATAAHATVTGPCTATGTINGTTYHASHETAVIPRQGAVRWTGAINTGAGTRNISGKVYLKLPPPFGKMVIGNGSWDGPSSRRVNTGVYHYDFPSALIGPKFVLSGEHAERGTVVCTGAVTVTLEGSKSKNPVLIASLVLTFFAILNVGLVMRARPR